MHRGAVSSQAPTLSCQASLLSEPCPGSNPRSGRAEPPDLHPGTHLETWGCPTVSPDEVHDEDVHAQLHRAGAPDAGRVQAHQVPHLLLGPALDHLAGVALAEAGLEAEVPRHVPAGATLGAHLLLASLSQHPAHRGSGVSHTPAGWRMRHAGCCAGWGRTPLMQPWRCTSPPAARRCSQAAGLGCAQPWCSKSVLYTSEPFPLQPRLTCPCP